jgi:hypothetical protein
LLLFSVLVVIIIVVVAGVTPVCLIVISVPIVPVPVIARADVDTESRTIIPIAVISVIRRSDCRRERECSDQACTCRGKNSVAHETLLPFGAALLALLG